jgi:hypothetical protein
LQRAHCDSPLVKGMSWAAASHSSKSNHKGELLGMASLGPSKTVARSGGGRQRTMQFKLPQRRGRFLKRSAHALHTMMNGAPGPRP